jgi:hypothetical protein
MNKIKSIACASTFAAVIAAFALLLSGCVYQVPLTSQPTRPVDDRLLGSWSGGTNKLKIVKLDAHNYIASSDGDLYRVYHSDVADTPLVTVQVLDQPNPQYCYYSWKISDDGKLHIRMINDKIIPDDVKSSAAAQKLVRKNLQNPELFGDDSQFTKDK